MIKEITILDVAKEVGVSKTTISRYLNGKYEYMSATTRARIKEVIDKLEYKPNNVARSLKSKKSNVIGVIVADISNPFSSILTKGISDVCNKNKYQMLVVNTNNDKVIEKEQINYLYNNNIDGLIIDTAGSNDSFLISLKSKINNIVLVDRILKEEHFDSVTSNNYQITIEAINYMISLGYKNIYFVSQEIENVTTREIRKKAFVDSMGKICNKSLLDNLIIIDDSNEKFVKDKILEIRRQHDQEKVGFFVVNGVTLLKLLKIIKDIKLEIPKDIGICSYEDWEWSELVGPGITSIKQQSYEMGKVAAECLINKIENKNTNELKTIELQCKIIKRGSL